MTRHIPTRRGQPILALLVHIIVLIALAAAWMGVDSRALGVQESLSLISAILVGLSVWLALSWWLAEGELLNPYGLFLLGSMPFHVGYAFLRLINQDHLIWLRGSVTEAQLLVTLAFVTGCYALLHFGALAVSAAGQKRDGLPLPVFDGTRVYQVGWLLLAISLVPLLIRLKGSIDTVMSGGYSSLFEGGGRDPSGMPGIVALISEFYLPGVMFLLAGSQNRRFGQVVALAALVLYSGTYLFLGFRAFSLIPIAAFVWVWHRCIRRLPVFPVVASGVGLFLIVAPLVRRVRDMAGADRMSLESIWQAYTGADNPVLSLIAELAGSVLTIAFTIELVPDVRPFEWGYGYLQALVNAIPIWEMPDAYGYAGSWLAWHVTPQLAVGGFGLGFSFMAEAYLNFGFLGGAVMVGLIGALVAGAQKWADRAIDPARVAFIAAFLPILIFFTRGESLSITRPILWYALIPLVMVYVLRLLDRRIAGVPPSKKRHPPAFSDDRMPEALRREPPGWGGSTASVPSSTGHHPEQAPPAPGDTLRLHRD
ncbi:MAG: O-antigen polysaccharide polymerase Wzy [Rhodothermales bacterium]|nr:O-antigen polysaccharide polymerase Wzy [Rhodothermales bacterium]MBO6780752.1 O-antigen polysaccharide polymerase Wzy [Rhodothermales bacterium]